MTDLTNLSIFVGTGDCNAHCPFCAGLPLRESAPQEDGIVDRVLVRNTVIDCWNRGARNLSLSSSGEPTLSPKSLSIVLGIIHKMSELPFDQINLYTNGIKIGTDQEFCDQYLPLWKSYGLTHMYITVHSTDSVLNAKAYGVKFYPLLQVLIDRIKQAGFILRANVVLNNKNICDHYMFIETATQLLSMGVDTVSAWPLRDMNDEIDAVYALSETEMALIREWIADIVKKNKYGY